MNNIEIVFSKFDSLSQIGSMEQYSNYLDTIYPNSKVKNIVFRGATDKSYKMGSNQSVIDLTFFTGSQEAANKYAEISAKKYSSSPLTIMAVVNASNPLITNNVTNIGRIINLNYYLKSKNINVDNSEKILSSLDDISTIKMFVPVFDAKELRKQAPIFGGDISHLSDEELEIAYNYSPTNANMDIKDKLIKLGYDSVIVKESKDWFDFDYDQIGVLEGNYLVLGSEEDINGFKNFVGNKKLTSEINEIKILLKKLMV